MTSDLVSFIREQLNAGRDPRTIRDYLLSRDIDKKSIDNSFDIVFGAGKKEKKSSVEKFVIAGVVFLLVLLVFAGVNIYNSILVEPNPVIPPPTVNLGQTLEPASGLCESLELDAKYDCYMSKFQKGNAKCYEIDDLAERKYCYRVYDFYLMEA